MDEQTATPAPELATGGPGAAAKDEAARQLVALVGGLLFVAAAVVVERMVSDPDFARTARMRAARVAERAASSVMVTAAGVADLAERAYRRECAG